MKFRFSYLDNLIEIKENVFSLEIENKRYFFRIINDLINTNNSQITEDLYIYEKDEINVSNKLNIVIDFFNLDITLKKYLNHILKCIINELTEEDNNKFAKNYNNLINYFKSYISKIDLPIQINDEFSMDAIIKITKPSIKSNNELLNKLMLLIELENKFKINKIIIFINLKQYLTTEQLNELYKYAIYNNVKLLMIDSQSYGTTLNFENKLIIDNELNEILL